MDNGALSQLVLRRVSNQRNSSASKEGESFADLSDPYMLPLMKAVDTWQTSVTRMFGEGELKEFVTKSPTYQSVIIGGTGNSYLCMAAIAEYIMHGEGDKAIEFARALFKKNRYAKPEMINFFGKEIVDTLQENSQS